MNENKSEITTALTTTLKLTRAGYDIDHINYAVDPIGDEYCYIIFTNGGSRKVNVTADSGIALISDVVRALI